ncbi:MFS transporter [Arthrobacter sp. GMC3]|uniref:MFS transporter n=1 Tax=Arthrobacter sp. GMC3 TaxID=2058894 RepID=UPI000CE35589|nr:MFS transporter [Arthrobacter sp. GMC3]
MNTGIASPSTTTVKVDPPRARVTLVLASMGFFLITLDILIVNLALAKIGQELGGGTIGRQWVIDGYTLPFAALLLFAGNLSDRIGAKRALGSGIVLFLFASIGCAVAPSLGVLIAARVVQGAGAAVMLPASMALIREAFPDPRRRTHALGIWAVGGAVAGAVGPLAGGLLTTVDWRLVFGINLPVCITMLVFLGFVAHSPKRPMPFDWAGQGAALIALTALMFGLITGGGQGFGHASVIVSLVIAGVGVAGFLLIQARVPHPMMPLDLFRSTGMRIALLDGFVFMVGNFGSVFVVSLYLQQHLGLSPLLAGLVFLPAAAFSITGNIISGTLSNRFGPHMPITLGLTVMAAGFIGLVTTAPMGSPVLAGLFLIFTGAGGAIAMPPVTAVVLSSVPAERAGTASAVFNTFRQIGGAVAIAVFGALIATLDTFVAGMQTSFTIAAAALLLAALVSLRIRTHRHDQGV